MGNADITLRHLSHRHAEALARPYLPDGPLELIAWADTQVTAIERRLDKTLLLRIAGKLHALELEFAYRYTSDLPERVHEYQGLSRRAFRGERPNERPPPIESVVILLTGRRKPWPAERALRTRWQGRKFSGTRFRLDAVYQRTVAELYARQPVLARHPARPRCDRGGDAGRGGGDPRRGAGGRRAVGAIFSVAGDGGRGRLGT